MKLRLQKTVTNEILAEVPEEEIQTAIQTHFGFDCTTIEAIDGPRDGMVWVVREESRIEQENGSVVQNFALLAAIYPI